MDPHLSRHPSVIDIASLDPTKQCTLPFVVVLLVVKPSVKPQPQLLGQLPPECLTPDLTFDHVGIDYTGMSVSLPLNYQSIKAVHPELVSDLTIQMLLLQKVAVELGPDHLHLRVPA